jgi:hypothetical protein
LAGIGCSFRARLASTAHRGLLMQPGFHWQRRLCQAIADVSVSEAI